MKATKTLLAAAAALGLAASVTAQNYGDLEGPKAALKISELPSDFTAVRIKLPGGGGMLDMMGGPMMMIFGMMGSMGGSDQPPFGLFSAIETSWTNGQMVERFGQRFLVTYKFELDMGDMIAMEKERPDLAAMPLSLVLVRPDAIQSLMFRPELTRQKFADMLKLPPPAPKPKPEPIPSPPTTEPEGPPKAK